MLRDTLVLNFFAGPSSGKSTLSAGVFSWLKSQGVLAELVTEFAKDLVWSERFRDMDNQLFVFGVQHHRIWNLIGQVDVAVVDGPLLHSIIYDRSDSPTFTQLVQEEHRRLRNLNIFVERAKPFVQEGRVHNEEQSRQVDTQVREMLTSRDSFLTYLGLPESIPLIGNCVLRALGREPK